MAAALAPLFTSSARLAADAREGEGLILVMNERACFSVLGAERC